MNILFLGKQQRCCYLATVTGLNRNINTVDGTEPNSGGHRGRGHHDKRGHNHDHHDHQCRHHWHHNHHQSHHQSHNRNELDFLQLHLIVLKYLIVNDWIVLNDWILGMLWEQDNI